MQERWTRRHHGATRPETAENKHHEMFPPSSRHHHHNTSQSSPIMDSSNIKTASVYINNLLLARGLLRDGKPIEFARPSKADGGKEVTMAQIINLVHDLVLKRDVRVVQTPLSSTTGPVDHSEPRNPHQTKLTASPSRIYSATKGTAKPSPKPSARCAPTPRARHSHSRNSKPATTSYRGSSRSRRRRSGPRGPRSARRRRRRGRCARRWHG